MRWPSPAPTAATARFSPAWPAPTLVLDDWGIPTLNDPQRRDVLEILEDRYAERATVISSQLPVASWYDMIGDPTMADAILDRVIHNAYKIALTGDSRRKGKETNEDE